MVTEVSNFTETAAVLEEPAPNAYKLPTTVGFWNHDPSKWKNPAYSIRQQLKGESPGLGPGLYKLSDSNRFGPPRYPKYTMGAKYHEPYDFVSPGPMYYKPEKFYHAKQNPPKFTMAKRTPLPQAGYIPAPNSYKVPSALGPRVPDKPCNGAFTIGTKTNTPQKDGFPAPNKYGPVKPNLYKPSAPKYTMRVRGALAQDRTQKPAPNTYKTNLKHKPMGPNFSFGRKGSDTRIVYFTLADIRQ